MPSDPSSHPLDAPFEATLQRARAGHRDALARLFQRFFPEVEEAVHRVLAFDLRRTRPWLGSRISTGDVVQEVFHSVLQDLSGFRGSTEKSFTGYLTLLVRNRLVDAIRHHEAAQRDGRRTSSGGLEMPNRLQQDPLEDVLLSEEVRRFREVMGSFS